MVIDFRYVFLAIAAISLMSLAIVHIYRPVPIHRKWNWRNPHEKLMVTIFVSWVLIFVAKAYSWVIIL